MDAKTLCPRFSLTIPNSYTLFYHAHNCQTMCAEYRFRKHNYGKSQARKRISELGYVQTVVTLSAYHIA